MTLLKELSTFTEAINRSHDDAPYFRVTLKHLREKVEMIQRQLDSKGAFHKSASNVGADVSYIETALKAADDLEEALRDLEMYSNIGND